MPLAKVIKYFQSYGLKCDESLVQEWLNSTTFQNDPGKVFCEDDLYDFNEWCRWAGTAHEEGNDKQTKLKRLLEEIETLKIENAKLKKELETLANQVDILPF